MTSIADADGVLHQVPLTSNMLARACTLCASLYASRREQPRGRDYSWGFVDGELRGALSMLTELARGHDGRQLPVLDIFDAAVLFVSEAFGDRVNSAEPRVWDRQLSLAFYQRLTGKADY